MRPGYRWIHTGPFSCTPVRHLCRWVNQGSFGSLGSALGGVGFMRVFGFIGGRWFHSGAPWGSLGSSGVVGFTPVRPGGLWVHLGSFGSLGSTLVALGSCASLGSSEAVGFTRVRHGGRWVHPWLLGSRGWFDGYIPRGWVH